MSIQQALSKFTRGLAVIPLVLACHASAQTYPSRAITIVVPSAPGGTTDFTARLLAEVLPKTLKQGVLVDNRPGAAGNVGTQYASRAKPDGHTLLMQYSGIHVTNPWLYKNLGWHPVKDFTGVGMALVAPHLFVAHPSLPVKTLSDLAQLARSSGGALTYASSGVGSIQHIGTEMFLQRIKAKMVHVPYKGAGPAVIDLLGGHVAVFNTTPPSVINHVRAGKLRALAYLSKERHTSMQEIPTAAEAGAQGYEIESWFAMFAPLARRVTLLTAWAAKSRGSWNPPNSNARRKNKARSPRPWNRRHWTVTCHANWRFGER